MNDAWNGGGDSFEHKDMGSWSSADGVVQADPPLNAHPKAKAKVQKKPAAKMSENDAMNKAITG
eukprot:7985305-Alexandrium_andersonii.AAC.1